MATVFSVEAVASGQIPAEGAHARAAQLVVERIGDLATAHGAEANILIYGSVGSDRMPDIRSDVDGVVVVDDFLRDGNAVTTGRILGDISAATHVPLDVRVM